MKAKKSILIAMVLLGAVCVSCKEKKLDGFAFVKGGSFVMGSADGEGEEGERPAHTESVKSFYMGVHEVTQAEYMAVMGKTGIERLWLGDENPARVKFYAAIEYCYQRSVAEGLEPCYSIDGETLVCDFNANGYRLPTEAEWEYAARGGSKSKGYRYSGSDDIDSVAWYVKNSGYGDHAVMTKAPNELGLYDMSGNALEWCYDFFKSYETGELLEDEDYRVVRGGHHSSDADRCRPAYRSSEWTSNFLGGTAGFRLVRSAK